MMTIKQFQKKLYSLHGNKTPISGSIIPIIISGLSGKGIGFSSVISSFIDEIKQYCPQKTLSPFAKNSKACLKNSTSLKKARKGQWMQLKSSEISGSAGCAESY